MESPQKEFITFSNNDVARTLKMYKHQMETTVSSNDPLALHPFSKRTLPLRAVPKGMENHIYHVS